MDIFSYVIEKAEIVWDQLWKVQRMEKAKSIFMNH